jgi:hypothetical protein
LFSERSKLEQVAAIREALAVNDHRSLARFAVNRKHLNEDDERQPEGTVTT